jgi:hypothetical protein
MRKKLIAAALIAVAFAGPARAEFSAKDLLKYYASENTIMKNFAEGLIVGMERANWWANKMLILRKNSPFYCQPDNLSLTTDQDADILQSYVSRYPETSIYPSGNVFLLALQATFPCPVSGHAN